MSETQRSVKFCPRRTGAWMPDKIIIDHQTSPGPTVIMGLIEENKPKSLAPTLWDYI